MLNRTAQIKFDRKVLFALAVVVLIGIAVTVFYIIFKPKGPICGNGICDYFETPDDCCKDCSCWKQGEVCNIDLNKCEKREIKITDERIRELVIQYFENKGEEVVSMNITSLIAWENKLGKNVMVYIKEKEWFIPVIVTEDEKVTEFQI